MFNDNPQEWYEDNMVKFKTMCADAIGLEKTIVLEKTRRVTRKFSGTIIKATPEGLRFRGRSVVVQFRILLKNQVGTERSFVVEKLPREY